ncbi:MAG: DUF2142 domain-containing protein [Actinomycetota bacterium]|nr:DUF2142 domain-containing protein [Actinomycetota bacterium]
MTGGHPRRGQRHGAGFLLVWGVASALLFVMTAAWSLSTPIPSGPDEPAQYVRAAAIDHGHLTGRPTPGPDAEIDRTVTLPATYANLSGPNDCYYGNAAVPGGCSYLLRTSSKEVPAGTYVSNYPPLYYVLTGVPSLVSSSLWALRAMRLVSGVIVSLLLGLALAAAVVWSRMRWLVIGIAVAITPLVIYLGSVINPSAMEISAAIASWTTLVVLVYSRSGDPPPGLVWAWAISSAAFILSRPLSPVFLVCVVAGVVVLQPRRALELARCRSMKRAVILTAVVLVGELIFEVIDNGFAQGKLPFSPTTPETQIVTLILGLLPRLAGMTIGSYGSPDTSAPAVAIVIWFFATALLVGAVVVVARRREAALIVVVVVGTLVILPFVADLSHARIHGLLWQGRHGLPLAVGIPILAAALLSEHRVRLGRAPPVILGGLAVGQLVSWYWVLRRYTVGLGPAVSPLAHVPSAWHPPLSYAVLLPLIVVPTVVLAVMAWVVTRRPAAALSEASLAP